LIENNVIKECLKYEPKTGKIYWNYNKICSKKKIGGEAGYLNKRGYIEIRINYKLYTAHRVAWFLHYGEWPKQQIDHINGIRNDNRIENLRDVSCRENGQNRIEHRCGKLPGTSYLIKNKKWQAQIQIKGKIVYLGIFKTEIGAHEKYLQFLKEKNKA